MLLGQLSRPPPEALLSQATVLSCRETGSFGGGGAAWGGGLDVFDDGELQVHGESASGLQVHRCSPLHPAQNCKFGRETQPALFSVLPMQPKVLW